MEENRFEMSRPENDAVLQNERLGTLKKIFL